MKNFCNGFSLLTVLLISNGLAAQVWSSDGLKIAFFYIHSIEDIYLVNSDGTGFEILDKHPDRDFGVCWSPDGKGLLFTSIRDKHHEVYHINIKNHKVQKLTETNYDSEDGGFSPDGKRIVFSSNRDGNQDLYIMRANGKEVKRLTNTENFKEVSPRWSPDGSKILFVGGEENPWDLWVINNDGTDKVNLTNTPEKGEFHPSWSHDGSKIAYVTVVDDAFEIHIAASDGSGDRTLVRKQGYQAFFPQWSPDGKWLAFTRDIMEGTEEGMPALYKVDMNGSETLITQENSFHLYPDK